jgi:hypothetical protein
MSENTERGREVLGTETADFIYFDGISAVGSSNGIIQIELGAHVLVGKVGGEVQYEIMTTAHLRCTPTAAVNLRNAIDKALEMTQRAENAATQPQSSVGKH